MKTQLCAAVFTFFVASAVIGHGDMFLTTDVITDVVTYLGWTDAIFVYDRTLSSKFRQDLLTEFGNLYIGIISLQLPSSQNDVISSVMSTIKNTTTSSVILCIQRNDTANVLQQANQFSMLSPPYQWLVICNGKESADLVRVVCPDPCNVAMVIPDITSPDYIAHDLHSLTGNCLAGNLTKISTESSMPPNHTTVSRHALSFTIYSFDVKITNFSHVASWTSRSRLKVNNDVIYCTEFHDFNGDTLRVGTYEASPFIRRRPENGTMQYGGNGTFQYEGFCFAILDEMAHSLNFTYRIIEPPDGRYGGTVNGTWNGMIGMLMRKEIDIAVGPFTINSERMSVVDFTVPFMEDGGGILTKGGDPGPDLMKVFRPFPPLGWLMAAGAIVVTSVVLYLIINLSNWAVIRGTFLQRKKKGDEDEQQQSQQQNELQEPWNLPDCLLVVWGSLMSQGAPRHPKCSSGRLVLGFWWLFTILVVSIYTASLAAQLAIKIQDDTIDSIDELVASSLEPVAIIYTSWWNLFMKAPAGTVYGAIGERMAKAPTILDSNEGQVLVRGGTTAYITDVNEARYLYGQDCHNLHLASVIFSSNGLGFAVPKHAVYREAMNDIILRLQEAGILERWKKQWWQTSPECSKQGATLNNDKRLGVRSIGGILLAYAIVIALALLCQLWSWIRLRLPCCKKIVRCSMHVDGDDNGLFLLCRRFSGYFYGIQGGRDVDGSYGDRNHQ